MQLHQFLAALIHTYGSVLKNLEAFFGEEIFTEIMERAPELALTEREKINPRLYFHEESRPHEANDEDPYETIRSAVLSLKLTPSAEFYVWAYPPYRYFVECPLPLDAHARSPHRTPELQRWAKTFHERWVKNLGIPGKILSPESPLYWEPWNATWENRQQ